MTSTSKHGDGNGSGVGWVVGQGLGCVGGVGGMDVCCLHVLHLKSSHRDSKKLVFCDQIGSFASSANKPVI